MLWAPENARNLSQASAAVLWNSLPHGVHMSQTGRWYVEPEDAWNGRGSTGSYSIAEISRYLTLPYL